MNDRPTSEESIFLEAAQISSKAEQRSYLDRACGDDLALRASVESLLAACEQTGDLLDVSDAHAATVNLPEMELPEFVEQIGSWLDRHPRRGASDWAD